LLGIIEAEQTEKGKTQRNDRLIAVAAESHTHRGIKSLSQLDDTLLHEIEHFFIAYNAARGKQFKPLRRGAPDRAKRLVHEQRAKR
jgi:inorganic pyrophosphatase